MYFYTETAFHHQGEMKFMKELILASFETGAKGVKFQVLLDYDSFISKKHSNYDIFKTGLFSLKEWEEIFSYTNSLGLEIVFMPICTQSFTLYTKMASMINYIDIHSISWYDKEVLALVKETKKPIILGIGGRTTAEIEDKLTYFEYQLKVLMVGFQAFPSKIEDLRLGKIKCLKDKYAHLSIGYADHSSFEEDFCISSNEWAYFLGARYFEKHITTKEGEDRWDFQSAISKEKCTELVNRLNFINNQVMRYSNEEFDVIEGKELVYRNRQKICVARVDISKGTVITNDHISRKMIDNVDLGEVDSSKLLGKKTIKDFEEGEAFEIYPL